ncbi:MAG: VOC family protein [Planctomycetes bacterium]|nr:VOC family protein [Planctomycetota bacterium]MCB9917033.1 VOC family protein [Planctomycetota bacterium]
MSTYLTIEPRLHVADLQASLAFYRDVLGFVVTTLIPREEPTFAMLARDRVYLQLGGIGGARRREDRPTCTLWIDVHDVAELHGTLAAKATIEWGPEVFFYGRREFAVRDPDGHLVVFSEVTDDPATCREESVTE